MTFKLSRTNFLPPQKKVLDKKGLRRKLEQTGKKIKNEAKIFFFGKKLDKLIENLERIHRERIKRVKKLRRSTKSTSAK